MTCYSVSFADFSLNFEKITGNEFVFPHTLESFYKVSEVHFDRTNTTWCLSYFSETYGLFKFWVVENTLEYVSSSHCDSVTGWEHETDTITDRYFLVFSETGLFLQPVNLPTEIF